MSSNSFSKERIGIAGAGGIGSNIAVHLIRSGYIRLRLVDFDLIEEANLNRQFYFHHQIGMLKTEALKDNLLQIAPEADIETRTEILTPLNAPFIFDGCAVVAEALDHRGTKKMLIESIFSETDRIVAASGIAGRDLQNLGIQHIGKLTMVGDFISDTDNSRTCSVKVGICAAMMAHEIIEYLEGAAV